MGLGVDFDSPEGAQTVLIYSTARESPTNTTYLTTYPTVWLFE